MLSAKMLPIELSVYLFSLITRNPVFGVTTRYEIDQTAQLQRKTGYVVPSKQWTGNEGADQAMQMQQMQQADLRLWCSQRYKTGFLMARLYLFLLPPGVGERGTCSTPHPTPALQNNEWFFFCVYVRWIGCRGGGGGGGDMGIWHPALPLPHPIHIYLCGCGSWRDRQVIQDSAWVTLVIIKLARIIFAA